MCESLTCYGPENFHVCAPQLSATHKLSHTRKLGGKRRGKEEEEEGEEEERRGGLQPTEVNPVTHSGCEQARGTEREETRHERKKQFSLMV